MTLLSRKLMLTNHKRYQKLSRVECTQVWALIYTDEYCMGLTAAVGMGSNLRNDITLMYLLYHKLHLWNNKD